MRAHLPTPPLDRLVETLRAFAHELQQLTVESPALWRAELRVGGIQVSAEQRIDRHRMRWTELIGWHELLDDAPAVRCKAALDAGRAAIARQQEQGAPQ